MHLNDYQLLELDERGKLHLNECLECSKKAENLAKIRQALGNLPIRELPNKDWQTLKQLHLSENNNVKYLFGIKKRKVSWAISLGIAASVLLMVYIPSMSIFESQLLSENQELFNLIEESNQLQQSLFNSTIGEESDQWEISLIQSKINLVDQSLQQAYLHRRSIDEISLLWNKRIVLMKKGLSRTTNSIRI